MELFKKYPHLEGAVSMDCDLAWDEKTKEFAPGKKWGYRLGRIVADDATLAMFGTSVADILEKGKSVFAAYEIKDLTDDEAVDYLRKWTTLEEVEPRKFLVREASEFMGEKTEAEYIDLRLA